MKVSRGNAFAFARVCAWIGFGWTHGRASEEERGFFFFQLTRGMISLRRATPPPFLIIRRLTMTCALLPFSLRQLPCHVGSSANE